MTHVRTWREFVHHRVRDHQELEKAVLRDYRHLFTPKDLRVIAAAGCDAWPRIYRWFKREYRIYYPWDDSPEPPPPNYRDPAAKAMRRVFTPSTFLPPERR